MADRTGYDPCDFGIRHHSPLAHATPDGVRLRCHCGDLDIPMPGNSLANARAWQQHLADEAERADRTLGGRREGVEDPETIAARLHRVRAQTAATLPLHRTAAGWPHCSTCDGGGCPDCTDPA